MSRREENILRNEEFLKSIGFENPIPTKKQKQKKKRNPPQVGLRKSERSNRNIKINTNKTIVNTNKTIVVEDIDEMKYQKFAIISFEELKTFIGQNKQTISNEVAIKLTVL
jgi:hypothetical protein